MRKEHQYYGVMVEWSLMYHVLRCVAQAYLGISRHDNGNGARDWRRSRCVLGTEGYACETPVARRAHQPAKYIGREFSSGQAFMKKGDKGRCQSDAWANCGSPWEAYGGFLSRFCASLRLGERVWRRVRTQ